MRSSFGRALALRMVIFLYQDVYVIWVGGYKCSNEQNKAREMTHNGRGDYVIICTIPQCSN